MTLIEIREQFRIATGRHDLVDPADESDLGADFYINAGIRFLDRWQPSSRPERRYQRDVYSGEFQASILRCLAVTGVWMSNDEGRSEVEKKDLSWIRENYANMGANAVGTLTFTANPSNTETFVIDGTTFTFKTSPVGDEDIDIKTTLVATLDEAGAVINASSLLTTAAAERIGLTKLRVKASTAGVDGNAIVFTESINNASIDGSGTLGGTIPGIDGDVASTGVPTYYAMSVVGLAPEQMALTHQDYEDEFTYDAEGLKLESFLEYSGILWLPPADSTYTLSVFGKFGSKVLALDADENFWSVNHPLLTVQAGVTALEMIYRNTEGLRDAYAALQEGMRRIDLDMIEEESAGINQMRG